MGASRIWGRSMEKQALLKEQEARLTGTEVQTCSKEELRRWILQKRGGLSETEKRKWDAALFERIRALGLHGAGTVYCYASVRGEAGTGALIDWYLSEGVRVALPRTEIQGEEKRIRFYYIRSRAELVMGRFHIPEPPPGSERAEDRAAPVLAPGLAFSEEASGAPALCRDRRHFIASIKIPDKRAGQGTGPYRGVQGLPPPAACRQQ